MIEDDFFKSTEDNISYFSYLLIIILLILFFSFEPMAVFTSEKQDGTSSRFYLCERDLRLVEDKIGEFYKLLDGEEEK